MCGLSGNDAQKAFRISVLPGDGVWVDVTQASVEVLKAVEASISGLQFEFEACDVGATVYLKYGDPLPEKAYETCRSRDANRLNEPVSGINARYTFGEFLLEGSGGSIRLSLDGLISLQRLVEASLNIDYEHEQKNFAGDCVYATQRHFVDRLPDGKPFETDGEDYLKNIKVQEAVYQSTETGLPVSI